VQLPFEIFRDPRAMRAKAEDLRRDGRRIAVVPTMGALHDGHVALLRAARGKADVVILTIFVNPTQFGPQEDLSRYPRDEAGDIAKARAAGIDLAFCPDAAAMYPPGSQTFVEVRALQQPLCGASRPGHFAGVATVVAKLLNIVQPTRAYFGQKDAQQSVVIRRLVRDLNLPVEVIVAPTVREADGLALSSRNSYLTPEQRAAAPVIYRALTVARERFAAGERDAGALREAIRGALATEPGLSIDYVSVAEPMTLRELARVEKTALASTAVRLGATRLIDNLVLGAG